jgi:hypothetical protein
MRVTATHGEGEIAHGERVFRRGGVSETSDRTRRADLQTCSNQTFVGLDRAPLNVRRTRQRLKEWTHAELAVLKRLSGLRRHPSLIQRI